MTKPNLYTIQEPDGIYGLHRFKDGEKVICKQHQSGSWITLLRPTEKQEQIFRERGVRTK